MTEPKWITLARTYIGEKEMKGEKHNPKILDLWKACKLGGIKNDEIPWCAGFVGGILEKSDIISSRADSARSYLNWGVHVHTPMIGAIVIFERGETSGHVGFVVGRDENNNLMVLGGNQGDMVKIAPFDQDRVLGYRWPAYEAIDDSATDLPVLASNGQLSKNEA